MADVPISGLSAAGGPPDPLDIIPYTDVDDTSQAPTGTTKKMTVTNLFTAPTMTTVTVTSGGVTVSAGGITVTGNSTLVGAFAVSGDLSVTQDIQGKLILGRFDNASTYSYMKLSALSSGYKWQSTAGADIATLTNAGALTTVAGITATSGGLTATAGGLTVSAGGAAVTGNSTVTGTLDVTGKVTIGAAAAANLVVAGGGAAIATTATNGFLFITSCAGAPTGIPASIPTGTVPVVYDSSNNKFWIFQGSWRGVVVT